MVDLKKGGNMEELEKKQRQAVTDEAKTWINTPYHDNARVKGAGVDCGMLLMGIFENCGLIEHIDIPHYSRDWHLHRSEEKYLGWVKKYCHEVDRDPLPGDILLYQYGRCISHGAIVIDYPTVIHSFLDYGGVVYGDASQDVLKKRQKAVYSFW